MVTLSPGRDHSLFPYRHPSPWASVPCHATESPGTASVALRLPFLQQHPTSAVPRDRVTEHTVIATHLCSLVLLSPSPQSPVILTRDAHSAPSLGLHHLKVVVWSLPTAGSHHPMTYRGSLSAVPQLSRTSPSSPLRLFQGSSREPRAPGRRGRGVKDSAGRPEGAGPQRGRFL